MSIDWDVLVIEPATVYEPIMVERLPKPNSKVNILASFYQDGKLTPTAIAATTWQSARKEGGDTSPCAQQEEGSPFHPIIIVDTQNHTSTILKSGGNINPPPETISPDLIPPTKALCIDHNSLRSQIHSATGITSKANIPLPSPTQRPSLRSGGRRRSAQLFKPPVSVAVWAYRI